MKTQTSNNLIKAVACTLVFSIISVGAFSETTLPKTPTQQKVADLSCFTGEWIFLEGNPEPEGVEENILITQVNKQTLQLTSENINSILYIDGKSRPINESGIDTSKMSAELKELSQNMAVKSFRAKGCMLYQVQYLSDIPFSFGSWEVVDDGQTLIQYAKIPMLDSEMTFKWARK